MWSRSNDSIIVNSIIWSNGVTNGIANTDADTNALRYCCTDPVMGIGGFAADPQFVDRDAGGFRLSSNSACIDAGENADAPAADMDGLARPFDGDGDGYAVCDVGAYEFHGSAVDSDEDGLPDGWELRYGGSLTQMCAAADFDRDGMADDEEFRAGTSPDRSDSVFAVSAAKPADFRAGETILQWASSPSPMASRKCRSFPSGGAAVASSSRKSE